MELTCGPHMYAPRQHATSTCGVGRESRPVWTFDDT